jgi:hypothetical protein
MKTDEVLTIRGYARALPRTPGGEDAPMVRRLSLLTVRNTLSPIRARAWILRESLALS